MALLWYLLMQVGVSGIGCLYGCYVCMAIFPACALAYLVCAAFFIGPRRRRVPRVVCYRVDAASRFQPQKKCRRKPRLLWGSLWVEM